MVRIAAFDPLKDWTTTKPSLPRVLEMPAAIFEPVGDISIDLDYVIASGNRFKYKVVYQGIIYCLQVAIDSKLHETLATGSLWSANIGLSDVIDETSLVVPTGKLTDEELLSTAIRFAKRLIYLRRFAEASRKFADEAADLIRDMTHCQAPVRVTFEEHPPNVTIE